MKKKLRKAADISACTVFAPEIVRERKRRSGSIGLLARAWRRMKAARRMTASTPITTDEATIA
jgi:hypothetical protein